MTKTRNLHKVNNEINNVKCVLSKKKTNKRRS